MHPLPAPWNPLTPLHPCQWRHLVVNSGTTAGHHDTWQRTSTYERPFTHKGNYLVTPASPLQLLEFVSSSGSLTVSNLDLSGLIYSFLLCKDVFSIYCNFFLSIWHFFGNMWKSFVCKACNKSSKWFLWLCLLLCVSRWAIMTMKCFLF